MHNKPHSPKPGRNDPCSCGSGKKFKKCCLDSPPSKKFGFKKLTWGEVPEELKKQIQENAQKEAEHSHKFGNVNPMVHVDFKGFKLVGVGSELHWSKGWKTFHDFLMSYIATTLGGDWGDGEIQKPFAERHQILQWHERLCRFQRTLSRGADGLIAGEANGITKAYMLLAFDLYVLRHHLSLQEKVVDRLKNKDQFQGARHELFVASTFIKAGFDIDYEDESDSSSKHPEFIAKHKATGQEVSVEAKSRHRRGVLGFSSGPTPDQDTKAGVERLLKNALAKPVQHPYVICVDLNLPPSPKQVFEMPWFREVVETASKIGRQSEAEPSPFNQLLFTNHPFHYGKDDEPTPQPSTLSVIPKNPRIAIPNPGVLGAVHEAAEKYGFIPEHFE